MKTAMRAFGVFLVVAFYGLTIGFVNQYHIQSENNVPSTSEATENSVLVLQTEFFHFSAVTQPSILWGNQVPVSNYRNPFSNVGISSTQLHLVVFHKLARYRLFTANLLLSYRKSAISFPFHAFW